MKDNKLNDFRQFFSREYYPSLTEKSFSAVQFSSSHETFQSLGQLLDYYYQEKAEKDRIAQQASDLIHRVQSELEKNIKKLAKQQDELLATENAEEFRQKESF